MSDKIVSVKRATGKTEIVHHVIFNAEGIEIRCSLEDFAERIKSLLSSRILTSGRLTRVSDSKLAPVIEQGIDDAFAAAVHWMKESTAKT